MRQRRAMACLAGTRDQLHRDGDRGAGHQHKARRQRAAREGPYDASQ